jgi:hypothetical protein
MLVPEVHTAHSKGTPARPDGRAENNDWSAGAEGRMVAVCSPRCCCCCCCCTGTAQLPPQQAHVTPLQLPPRQQQFRTAGSGGSSMQRVLAAAGTVGGVLGVQVGPSLVGLYCSLVLQHSVLDTVCLWCWQQWQHNMQWVLAAAGTAGGF